MTSIRAIQYDAGALDERPRRRRHVDCEAVCIQARAELEIGRGHDEAALPRLREVSVAFLRFVFAPELLTIF